MNMATKPHISRFQHYLTYVLIVLCFSFSLLPSGFDWSQVTVHGSFTEGSRIFQLQFGSIFFLGALLAWHNRYWSLRYVRHLNPFLIIFVLYCATTMLWSPQPVVTLKRVTQLVGLIIVAIAISPPVGQRRQFIDTLLGTFTLLMMLSLFVVLTMPHLGVDTALGDAWRGIFTQKNSLGAVSALSTIFWARNAFERRLPLLISITGILFSLLLLIMSKSTTAMLLFMLCLGVYFLLRKRYLVGMFDGYRLVLSIICIIVSGLMVFYLLESRLPVWSEIFFPIEYFFHKSVDLTGRTDIWQLVLFEINKHPWLGIGYGAFWLGEGSASQYIIDLLYWVPLQSHNGYLDILNELGLIGIGLLACLLAFHINNLIRFFRIDREEAAIHWMLFVFILVSNISESELFRGVAFQNILFIFSSVVISSRLTLHKLGLASEQSPPHTRGT